MVLKLNKVQKIILVSLVLISALSWLLLSRQTDNDNNIVMIRAMMLYDPVAISLLEEATILRKGKNKQMKL